jgi:large subunit ribosomal protein LP0
MPLSAERKTWYFGRLQELLGTYTKIMVVQCDNVGSKQMADIRMALRGDAVVLLGKNTMIRKIMSNYVREHPGHPYEALIPRVRGNVGFIFTNGDLGLVREVVEKYRVPAPARVGAVAPTDVFVPPGPTGADPGQTSFFQVLQIPTKIAKGQIEITNEVHLIKKGDKVGNSEAALLTKLNIRPFTYGLKIDLIYDNGSIFEAAVLDLTDADLRARFIGAVRNLAAASLALGYPTLASLPHSIANAFKALVAVAVECNAYSFEKALPFRKALGLPEVGAAPKAAAKAEGGDDAAEDAPKEEKKEAAPAKKEKTADY